MDPITLIIILIIIACVVLCILIVQWLMKRYDICGKTDPLCYITGERTSLTNIYNKLIN